MIRRRHAILAVIALTVAAAIAPTSEAQVAGNATLEEAAPPGSNYDKAEFRLWYPNGSGPLQAIVVLVPGSNGDGRAMVDVAHGSGQALVGALTDKGGIYYSALVPAAARSVPGILFTGGKDLEFRTNTIAGLFAVNRRAGALWALAEEPSAAHIVGRSRDVAIVFFEDALALRIGNAPASSERPAALKSIPEKAGFLGDLKAKTFQPVGDSPVPNYPTAWLPTARVARAWQALVTETPFEKSAQALLPMLQRTDR